MSLANAGIESESNNIAANELWSATKVISVTKAFEGSTLLETTRASSQSRASVEIGGKTLDFVPRVINPLLGGDRSRRSSSPTSHVDQDFDSESPYTDI